MHNPEGSWAVGRVGQQKGAVRSAAPQPPISSLSISSLRFIMWRVTQTSTIVVGLPFTCRIGSDTVIVSSVDIHWLFGCVVYVMLVLLSGRGACNCSFTVLARFLGVQSDHMGSAAAAGHVCCGWDG